MPPVEHSQPTFEIQGTRLGYPAEFRDEYSILGIYLVPDKGTDCLIANSGFTCARVLPRRTLLNLICVHYTDTDCGNSGEIAWPSLSIHTELRNELGSPTFAP